MATHKTRIQAKLLRVIMLTCGIVLFLTCSAFLVYEYIANRNLAKQELSELGKMLALNSSSALAKKDKAAADAILHVLVARKEVIAATMISTDGKPLSVYPPNTNAVFSTKLSEENAIFGKGYFEMNMPVMDNGQQIGNLYLRSDLRNINERLILYYVISVVFFVLSFLLAFILSRRMQESITKPILNLAETAKIISEKKNYSVRAINSADDELMQLTEAFNHMLDQIENQNVAITALNQNLELEVTKRTDELQSAIKRLNEQYQFIQTIIDSSVDLIAVFDKDHRYLIINKRGSEIYQMGREEMVGRTIDEIFPKMIGGLMLSQLDAAFTGQFIHQDAYKSLLSDRYFENFFIPLVEEDGKILKVLVIGHDITNVMLANEALKNLNTSLENSNRELEQFAYVASHDLQEPLRKIQTFSELCIININKPEIQKRYLQKISSSASRMTDLIKAVLNYSKLSGGSNGEIIDLTVIVKDILNDLELLIQEKKAIIQYDKLPSISGSPLHIHQLVFNLVTNALKFNEREPVLHISAKIVSEKEAIGDVELPEGNYHEISFADNGIGFEEQYATRIFSIFQRLHSTFQYQGTGIGLALCKKIAENHKGGITVKSRTGEGSVFYVYLPVIS